MIEEAEIMEPSVVRTKPFLLLWLAQGLSQTMQNTVFYALMIIVEKASASTMHMSFLILSTIVPSIIMGLAAGVMVDRWHKRTVLITTNILRGIIVLAFLLFKGSLGMIYLVNLVFSIIAQFFAPAELATIPLLVRKRQLIAANGLFSLTFHGSQLAGFVIMGPLLLRSFGVGPLMLSVAAIFVLCGILTSFLPATEPARETLPYGDVSLFGRMAQELRDGLDVLRGDSGIFVAVLHMTLVGAFMLVMGMLAPGYVDRVLGLATEDTVFVLAPAGIGVALGLLALPRLVIYFPKERLVTMGLVTLTVALVGMSGTGSAIFLLGPNGHTGIFVAIVMVLAFALGVAFSLISVPAQTIIQERTPVDMRGRIFAAQLTLAGVVTILPLIFLGGLADLVGINFVLLLVAAVMAGLAIFNHRRKDLGLKAVGQSPFVPTASEQPPIVAARPVERLGDNEQIRGVDHPNNERL